ncbi:MAG: hypothetical protein WC710_15090, partial [Gallionella sp.]
MSKTTKPRKAEAEKKDAAIIAYKGFDKDLKCRDFQFEIGQTYRHEGDVEICAAGFHSCEYPINVFDYYPPTSRFGLVEASGKISKQNDGDTKIASAELHIKAELKIPDLITAAIKWITERCDPVKAQRSKGDQSASSATGDQSASSATGYQSASSATGYQSASSATGDQSASSATGNKSASSATGKNAVAM